MEVRNRRVSKVAPATSGRALVGPCWLTAMHERSRDGLGHADAAVSAAIASKGNAMMTTITHQAVDNGYQAIDDRPELLMRDQATQNFIMAANMT
eukprot:4746651-Amphidinium_carterae.1